MLITVIVKSAIKRKWPKLKSIILCLYKILSQIKQKHSRYILLRKCCWIHLSFKILLFPYRFLIVFGVIYYFVISVYLNCKIEEKLFIFWIRFAIWISRAATFIKIYINLRIFWIVSIIGQIQSIVTEICTNKLFIIPRTKKQLISFWWSKITLLTPFWQLNLLHI